MRNAAIVYATKTKHSKKLAEALSLALNIGAENILDNPKLNNTALLFIAGGIYGGASMPELVDYVKSLDSSMVQSAALITSCASGKQKQDAVRRILNEKGIRVAGEVIVPGSILFVRAGHPNKSDTEQVVAFAKGLLLQGEQK